MKTDSEIAENAAGQLLLSAAVTTAFHPISYVKTLIQLGYEANPPVAAKTIFGRKVLKYPGVLKYLSVIRREDGFFGMYRGLGARLVGGVVGNMVTNGVSIRVRGEVLKKVRLQTSNSEELDGVEETVLDQFVVFVKETGFEMVARCSGVIASQPLHVIMVRQMAQFVGKEAGYSSVYSSIKEIYRNEGIWGFFAGLVPRLCGDIIAIWLANFLTHVVNNFLMPKAGTGTAYMKTYTSVVSSLVVSQLTYPFMLVSNVMCVNDSGMKVARPIHDSWRGCWRSLARENSLSRGSSMFIRYYKGPVTFRGDGTMSPATY